MSNRKEIFPVATFRCLDMKLNDVRTEVMREAAKLAEHESTDPLAYTVESRHIERVWACIAPKLMWRVECDLCSAIKGSWSSLTVPPGWSQILVPGTSGVLTLCPECNNRPKPDWWPQGLGCAERMK